METHNLRNIIWLEACIVTPTSTKGLVAGYGAMSGDCSPVQHVIDIWYCGIGAGICGSGYIVELQTKVHEDYAKVACVIMDKAPTITMAFFWLKAPTSAFT